MGWLKYFWVIPDLARMGSKSLAEPPPCNLRGDIPDGKPGTVLCSVPSQKVHCALTAAVGLALGRVKPAPTWFRLTTLSHRNTVLFAPSIFTARFFTSPEGKSWDFPTQLTGCFPFDLSSNVCKSGCVLLWSITRLRRLSVRPDLPAQSCCPGVMTNSSTPPVPKGTWLGSKVGRHL